MYSDSAFTEHGFAGKELVPVKEAEKIYEHFGENIGEEYIRILKLHEEDYSDRASNKEHLDSSNVGKREQI